MLLLLAERSLVISGVDGCTTKSFLEAGSIEPDSMPWGVGEML
jgi:hypothetical protein